LGRVHPRTGTPVAALLVNLAIGVIAILSARTAELIVLSTIGAVTLYALSMVALFALRRREPDLPRPVRAIAYPLFPGPALALSVLSLASIVVTNWGTAVVFGAILLVTAGGWRLTARERALSVDRM